MDDGATVGRVLHHASGPRGAIGLAALSRAVRGIYAERGVELPPLRFVNPLAVACGALVLGRVLPEDVARRFAPVRPLLRYLATDQSFDTTSTEAWRARAGLELPPPSAYLDVVLRRHLEVTERRNRARQARRAA